MNIQVQPTQSFDEQKHTGTFDTLFELVLNYKYHRECTRGKPDDYTATYRTGKVLMLERWEPQHF